jgi:ABC-type amino acid transport substrate-binding protein
VYALTSLVMTAGVILATRAYLELAVSNPYGKDQGLARMQNLVGEAAKIMHREMPAEPSVAVPGESVLKRIRRTGVLRVGGLADNLPFSYFNINDQLVGLDAEEKQPRWSVIRNVLHWVE